MLPAEHLKALHDSVPFPRRLVEPEEFAFLAEHIISNPYMNGEVIRLDGALRMAPNSLSEINCKAGPLGMLSVASFSIKNEGGMPIWQEKSISATA